MNKKTLYRYSFTQDGHYIGCREMTKFDVAKPYLYWAFGFFALVGFIYLLLLDKNVRFDKERPPIALEVPSR